MTFFVNLFFKKGELFTVPLGSKNLGLAKLLGITIKKPYFEHPSDPDRKIYWIYDILHLLKCLRNNLMDNVVTLPGGHKVSKKDFQDILEKTRPENNDHTSCFHFSEQDLEVQNRDVLYLTINKFIVSFYHEELQNACSCSLCYQI